MCISIYIYIERERETKASSHALPQILRMGSHMSYPRTATLALNDMNHMPLYIRIGCGFRVPEAPGTRPESKHSARSPRKRKLQGILPRDFEHTLTLYQGSLHIENEIPQLRAVESPTFITCIVQGLRVILGSCLRVS